jgi:hypothetical protein
VIFVIDCTLRRLWGGGGCDANHPADRMLSPLYLPHHEVQSLLPAAPATRTVNGLVADERCGRSQLARTSLGAMMERNPETFNASAAVWRVCGLS